MEDTLAKKNSNSDSGKPSGHARNWTPAERREAFLKARAEEKEDHQVLRSDWQEELVPYGFLSFDSIMKLGGVGRRGRVTQIHGDEGAGKSTLTYSLSKNYQQFTGEPLAVYDFERTGTPTYLKKIGVDMDLCFFKQPTSVEDCIKDTIRKMDMGVRFFIYDSIPRMKSMVDKKDILNNKAFKANYGKHAQVMTKFYDLLLPYAAEYDCQFLMINQTRDRIEDSREAQQAQKYPSFTNRPYSLPGGRICRFTPSVMVEMKLEKALRPYAGKEGDDPFLLEPATPETEHDFAVNKVRCRSLKNKVTGTGFREGHIYVRPGFGVDENVSIRQYARDYGYIQNSGKKWFCGTSLEDAFIVYENKQDAIEDLTVKQNPEVLGKLKQMVTEAIEDDTTGRFNSAVDASEVRYLEGEVDHESDFESDVDSMEVDVEEV
jgi:RecA/RadA recombinase